MKTLCVVMICAAGFFASADASTLYTALLASNGDTGACGIVNASDESINVSITLLRDDGTVLFSQNQIAMNANSAVSIGGVVSDGYFCKFVVPNKKKVRAAAYKIDGATGDITAVLPAS